MLEESLALFRQSVLPDAWRYLWLLAPIWAPLIAVYTGFRSWMAYKQREWIRAQGSMLLEIKFPNEMVKSPASMEIFLQTLYQAGVGTLADVYLKGRLRPWFSLELVSDGGRVHFYIWLQPKLRSAVENQLYAQFPNVEVHDVPDYALAVHHDTDKYQFGKFSHMVLTKPDAYPIKTYVDYGLDKDPDEEYKNDPIAPVIEFLGSLKKGEHAWIQILLRAHNKEGLKHGRLFVKPDWKTASNEEIKKILKEAKLKGPEEKSSDPKFLSEMQKDTIKAIERSIEKTAFDSMIRVAYFAEKEAFNVNNIGGILGAFKQFSSNNYNGFKPSGYDFDYPWQDPFGRRKPESERGMLEAYKRRSHFYPPFQNLHDDNPFILTTEEVATLYHFPSSTVVATPTLARIPSKKASAPANLPL